MKLRLDEMVPVQVARELRKAGFDVDAVVEHPELRGLPDADQLARAADDQRALVSYDAGDLVPLAQQRSASPETHHGLVLLRSSRFPLAEPERIARALSDFIPSAPPLGFVHWLE